MQSPNPEYISALLETVNNSPFPQHLSMKLKSIDIGAARVELEVREYHLQPLQLVHGGVLATLIDTATFWSVFLNLPEETGMVNIDLKLNYLKSVKEGLLVAEGRRIKSGRTISYAEASVRNADGEIIAHGTSTLMALQGKGLQVGVRKFI
ncbi:MAG: PaaI family thioesterase [Deltaproteobacteria bacterium]|nr:PaaI family thioesterase [Deltaproteobacteria bacterium]MBW2192810.1 PaaI family thioesterase [Deltaproteobacteria bacterium]